MLPPLRLFSDFVTVLKQLQDQSGDIHYLEFLAATIEAVGVMEVSGTSISGS